MIDDESSLDLTRRILPEREGTRRGDPIPSLMAGSLSIVIGVVNLSAILGCGPDSMPGLVRRATIIQYRPTNSSYGGISSRPGWWYVPDTGFLALATLGLTLAAVGILLARRRGWPVTSVAGFGLNTIALLAGYVGVLCDAD